MIDKESGAGDPFGGLGVRVDALSREEFLKVKETLTRIGVSHEEGEISQTCFILHKRGMYAVMHHKEMRILDGEALRLTQEEVGHRNTVARMLDNWGLVYVDDMDSIEAPRAEPGSILVIPFKSKSNYVLRPLYEIGKIKSPAAPTGA